MEGLNIEIGSDFLLINGVEIKNNITENKLIDAIGLPDRKTYNGYGSTYNGYYIYDRYGMIMEFTHGKGSYMQLFFNYKPKHRPEKALQHVFTGILIIDGIEIPRIKTKKDSSSKEYIQKLNTTFVLLSKGEKPTVNIPGFYYRIKNMRIHFQCKGLNSKGLEVINLAFETRKKEPNLNKTLKSQLEKLFEVTSKELHGEADKFAASITRRNADDSLKNLTEKLNEWSELIDIVGKGLLAFCSAKATEFEESIKDISDPHRTTAINKYKKLLADESQKIVRKLLNDRI